MGNLGKPGKYPLWKQAVVCGSHLVGGYGRIYTMKFKVILVRNDNAALKVERALNEGWAVQGAYGAGSVLCLVMVKQ